MDAASILPRFSAGDAAASLAWFAIVAWPAGLALRRLAGWSPPEWPERWALTAVLGTLWASWTYWLLALAGCPQWHLAVAITPPVLILVWGMLAPRRAPVGRGAGSADGRVAQLLGLLLVAAFAVGYVARVSACIEPDESGVRLYGALYSDKLTNMSPCAALMHRVPPCNLRMSGEPFPYHYFPHLLVAAAARATGVDFASGFWFQAALLGILISGLAVLAFGRRALGSYGLALAALVYYGLTQFGTEARPLDLSLPLALLGIVALDRFTAGEGRRWGVLAVLLWASMPLYEAFCAMALLGGVAAWWAAGACRAMRSSHVRGELLLRTAVAAATVAGALLATRALTLGAHQVAPAKIAFKNSFRESYRDEWLNAVRESGDRPSWARTVLLWKRGKEPGPDGERSLPPELRPNVLERIAGEAIYDAGFAAYVLLRFVNVGLLGVIALALAWRSRPDAWRPIEALVAAVAVVGYGLPLVATWGHVAEGRWWETPNLYRLTHTACLLLVLLGAAVLVRALGQWRRARWWLPLGLAGWQLYALAVAAVQAPANFHHVDHERLAALAFLRREVPWGEVVIHPWIDDLIRDRSAPDRVAWVYKRHFTLGSNLAAAQMYYEGREDHLFIGGFIAPEEVYRRSRLRKNFYAAPDAETVSAVLAGGVRWVVADQDNPAPAPVASRWKPVFRQGSVVVFRK